MGINHIGTVYSPAELAKKICRREKRKGPDLDITQVGAVIRLMGDVLYDEDQAGAISYYTWSRIFLNQAKKRAERTMARIKRSNRAQAKKTQRRK